MDDDCERMRQAMGDWRKGREERQRSWESEANRSRVASGLSNAPATVTTGSLAFRLAKSYLSPFAVNDALDYGSRDIPLHLFLPELSGYTRENWRRLFDEEKVAVNILPNESYPFMPGYAAHVSRAGAPLREGAGLAAYASPSSHKCFPEELLTGELTASDPVFMNCTSIGEPFANCTAYLYAPEKAYTISVRLSPAQTTQWRDLLPRIRSLVESWRHAAR